MRPASALVAEAQNRIEAIAAETQPRTFLNTLGALDQASEKLDYASAVVQHLENVVTSPELRAAWNEVQPVVSAVLLAHPAACRAVVGAQGVRLHRGRGPR